MQLFTGMQIDLCASIKGIVQLKIAQIFPHAIVLQKIVNAQVTELLYLISPELRPEAGITVVTGRKSQLPTPIFFHRQGQFWYHEPLTMQDWQLETGGDLSSCHEHLGGYQYRHAAY
jgi:hypothetical protein